MHDVEPNWEQLRPLEQFMVDTREPTQLLVITAVFGFEEALPVSWVESVFAERIAQHPRFRSVLRTGRSGRCRFESLPSFDPATCVVWEKPADPSASADERVAAYRKRISAISSEDLDWSSALWRVHCFEGFAPSAPGKRDATTLVLRVHHVLGDGIALVKYCMRNVADGKSSVALPSRRGAARGYRAFLRVFYDAVFVFCGTLIPDSPSMFNQGPLGTEKFLEFTPPGRIPLARVRAGSQRLGVTVSDVFACALSGALQKYMRMFGDGTFPSRFHAALAFNRHMIENEDCSLNNAVVLVPMRLPIEEVDVAERLRFVTQETSSLKSSYIPAIASRAFSVLLAFPTRLRAPLWRHMTRRVSVVYTNVPGPSSKVTVDGHVVESAAFAAPSDGDGALVFSLFRYVSAVSIFMQSFMPVLCLIVIALTFISPTATVFRRVSCELPLEFVFANLDVLPT